MTDHQKHLSEVFRNILSGKFLDFLKQQIQPQLDRYGVYMTVDANGIGLHMYKPEMCDSLYIWCNTHGYNELLSDDKENNGNNDGNRFYVQSTVVDKNPGKDRGKRDIDAVYRDEHDGLEHDNECNTASSGISTPESGITY
jgi:hypothetical protein